ncbi:MAG: family 16 glycosylhydrolase [Phycisphaeraceae bacterium]
MLNQFRIVQFFLICFFIVTSTSGANPLDRPGFEFAWEDAFDGSFLDTGRWNALNRRNSFNNEKQYYRPEQVSVTGGNLILTATDEALDGKAYRSGLVRTIEEQTYGRWEIRANLPTTQGMWPAIWLLPRTAPWPTGGEIDIMENRGSNPFVTSSAYHWGPSWPSNFVYGEYQESSAQGDPVNFHESFNTYAVEWEPEEIRYYVNDNLHFTVHESVAPISSTPMSLIINLAIGGDFGGDPNGSTQFPQEMQVDYVRVWELGDQASKPPFVAGPNMIPGNSFESESGGLSGWIRFGGGPNVALSSQEALVGDESLKVFGNNGSSTNYSGVARGFAVEPGQRLRFSTQALVSSEDPLVGDNYLDMKIEFYSQFGGGYGTPAMISILDTQIANSDTVLDDWLYHQIEGIAPANAVEARVVFVFAQLDRNPGSVYLDGTSLQLLQEAIPGDANADGEVNLIDLSELAANFNQTGNWAQGDFNADNTIDLIDLSLLAVSFGQPSTPTPEPASAILFAVVGLALRR